MIVQRILVQAYTSSLKNNYLNSTTSKAKDLGLNNQHLDKNS